MNIVNWQSFVLAFSIGGGLAFILLALGHWVPVGGGRGQLPTTLAGLIGRYVYGSFMCWVGFTVGLVILGLPWWLSLGLLIVYAIGGSAVPSSYGWDKTHDAILQSRMARKSDDELSRR